MNLVWVSLQSILLASHWFTAEKNLTPLNWVFIGLPDFEDMGKPSGALAAAATIMSDYPTNHTLVSNRKFGHVFASGLLKSWS